METRKLAALAAVAAVTFASHEVCAETEDDFQLWAGTFLTVDVPVKQPNPAFWLDAHARRSDAASIGILRPGVGLHVAPFASIWAGYAWIPTARDDVDEVVNEHRAWQQLILQHKLDFGVSLQSRLRFEQRFSEAGEDVAFRYRQFMRVGWQFTPAAPVGLAVWDELFFGMGDDADWGPKRGFDQNRFFAGPFWQATAFARVEAGYLSHFVERGEPDLLGHTLALNVFFAMKP